MSHWILSDFFISNWAKRIYSLFGWFETTFVKNVKVKRGKETITGNELYLILDVDEEIMKNNPGIDQNLIRISYNVFYESPGYTLKADILEIDLISKNMKIFMNNKIKKVTATGEIE